jgi:hypothetical protein
VATIAIAGCASAPTVQRVYGGDRSVEGRYVEPQSYAVMLRGVMAEAAGDLRVALGAYARAARLDPHSPEVWARIGAVRCAVDPRDARSDAAFARAIDEDPSYARAWAERARCERGRGATAAAEAAAQQAAALGVARTLPPWTARLGSGEGLDALTTDADPASAWTALSRWAEDRGDVAVWAQALAGLAKAAPGRRESVARGAEQLAGLGEIREAQHVAGAAADADAQPTGCCALAARLAIDEALERRDLAAARRRASRLRVADEEVAARALLAGQVDAAREVASRVLQGGGRAFGAALVLAAIQRAPAPPVDGATPPVSGAAWVAYARELGRGPGPSEATRAALASLPHAPIVPGDDRVVRIAVQLAARGAIGTADVPPDGLVELRVLGGTAVAEGWSPPDPRTLDARHEYLALALTEPRAPATRALEARFAQLLPPDLDRVVAVASAVVRLGDGAPIDRAMPATLLARDPEDPLVAAAALRLAEKVGDAEVARRARAAMTDPHTRSE